MFDDSHHSSDDSDYATTRRRDSARDPGPVAGKTTAQRIPSAGDGDCASDRVTPWHSEAQLPGQVTVNLKLAAAAFGRCQAAAAAVPASESEQTAVVAASKSPRHSGCDAGD